MTIFCGAKSNVKFDGGCRKLEEITFHHGKIVNVYTIYEKDLWPSDPDSKFRLIIFSFGALKLNKDANPDKYTYSEYVIEFDVRGTLSLVRGFGLGKNIIIYKRYINSL